MKRLEMHNGDVTDVQRCPECGNLLDYEEPRGDEAAYVHVDDRLSDCFKPV